MYAADKTIGNYALDQFIGYGASSVVFKGHDVRCKKYGVSKNVAIKFIWNREMALEEVRRLEQTQGVFEICDLITYDEANGAEVMRLIGDTIRQIEKAMNSPLPIEEDATIGVLILKLINGSHLIDRTLYYDEAIDHANEWTVHFEHPERGDRVVLKEWLTPVTRELDVEKRIGIIIQLAQAIQSSHDQGVVHGDLNPWNVFYQEDTERINIIDLGRNNFGVQGWRAPEHNLLMTGEIDTLPPETDIHLIGKWMMHLLPKKGPWSPLIHRCLNKTPSRRPKIQEIIRELKSHTVRKPRLRMGLVAAMFIFSLAAGIYALQQRAPFNMNPEGFNRISVLPFEGSAAGKTVAEMVSKSLGSTQDFTVIRNIKSQSALRSIRGDKRSNIKAIERAAEAMGAQFVLSGDVIESDTGYLTWNGILIQQNGAHRKLRASGQNALILADSITSTCLKLLGSTQFPMPASDFYSNNLSANFLYIYGNEFLAEGNFNAALPMFDKAVHADPDFHWAKAKLAYAHFTHGNLALGRESLLELLENPEVVMNPTLHLTVQEYMIQLLIHQGEHDRALSYVEDSILIAERNELVDSLSRIYMFKGKALTELGEFDEADEVLSSADAHLKRSYDNLGRLENLLERIHLAHRSSNPIIEDLLEEALELSQLYGLDFHQAIMLRQQAVNQLVFHRHQTSPQVLANLEKASAILDQVGNAPEIMMTDFYISYYHFLVGNHQKARLLSESIVQDAKHYGLKNIIVLSSVLLSDIAVALDRLDEAEHYLDPLVNDETNLGRFYEGFALSRMAMLKVTRNQFEEAASYMRRTKAIYEASGDVRGIAFELNNLGELYERQGLLDQAEKLYLQSIDIKRTINDQFGISWTLRNLIMLSIKKGTTDQINQYLAELKVLDPDHIQTKMVMARFEYEKGNFKTAYEMLTNAKRDAQEKGRWHERHEVSFGLIAKAYKQSRYIDLPNILGND